MYIYLINLSALISLHFLFNKYKNPHFEKFIWILVIFLLFIFVGFRYEIGGDWIHYGRFFQNAQGLSFDQIIFSSLVYVYINKIANYLGIQFVGVNIICAAIFMFSLALFLYETKNKWLGLVISFPIIIVVLSMGYTRQGLAFSFLLFLIRALENKQFFKSVCLIILSVFSHKSALFISSFLVFLYLWYHKKYFYLVLSLLIPIFFGIIFWGFYKHYIYFYAGFGQHMFSYGSLPRSLLILFVGIFFMIYKAKFKNMNEYQIFIYTAFSYMIIFLFPFSITTSIVADRLLFYLYPLKLVFISFADLEDKTLKLIAFILTSSYFFYFIIWIFFGKNSLSWVPYKFVGF